MKVIKKIPNVPLFPTFKKKKQNFDRAYFKGIKMVDN